MSFNVQKVEFGTLETRCAKTGSGINVLHRMGYSHYCLVSTHPTLTSDLLNQQPGKHNKRLEFLTNASLLFPGRQTYTKIDIPERTVRSLPQ